MKTVTVVGAGGQMGQWFSKYFADKGFEVTGFDSENPSLFQSKTRFRD